MKKTSNFELINESDVIDIKLKLYKEHINKLQDKEEFVHSLPYADDQPRHGIFKMMSCDQVAVRMFKYGTLIGIITCHAYVIHKYQGSSSRLRWWKNVIPFSLGHGLVLSSFAIFYPACQITNRDDMGPMIAEEIVLRTLIEKCDMYDYIDALLDLKYKYSEFEMNQLTKDYRNIKYNNSLDNFKYFKEISEKKV